MADCGDNSCGCSQTTPSVTSATTIASSDGWISLFSVPKMDCPSEERMIRMALDPVQGIVALAFDLSTRELSVQHLGPVEDITARLQPLGFGATLVRTEQATATSALNTDTAKDDINESRTLWLVLAINAIMFVVELTTGWLAESTGLIADSLDMFADAAVYGLSLYAVGRAAVLKQRSAHLAGLLQLLLALGALFEVVRRFIVGSDPQSTLMMAISLLALVANVACLILISRHRSGGVHMKASWIFSTNDVIANLGVIAAGALVAWTGSAYPDLVIGLLIGLVVLSGAVRILRLKS